MTVLYESLWCQQILKEGKFELIMRQLRRRLGELAPQFSERLQGLSVEQLEELAEALLDFSEPADLEAWLQEHQETSEDEEDVLAGDV